MIKFSGDSQDDGRLIGVGLSRGNCERLLAGIPISLDLRKDFNIPWRGLILLMGGENEQAIADEMAPWITPDTKIIHDPSLDEAPAPATGGFAKAPVEKSEAGFKAAVGAENGMVVFDMGNKGVTSFGLTPEGALRLAEVLATEAAKAEAQRITAKAEAQPKP